MKDLSYVSAWGGITLAILMSMVGGIDIIKRIYGVLSAQCLIFLAIYLLLLGKVRSE